MRILTEQELRRTVDSTVRQTLTENSQNEGIGWLLAGAAGLLGLHFWPQIKSLFTGGSDSGNSGQTPSQEPGMPSSGTGSGNTDTTLPPLSGSPSDAQLEDWQKEWKRLNGQNLGQDPLNNPSFKDAPPQARIDGQRQGLTRPGGEYSELDKVDALLSNPAVMRQLSRDEMRALIVYRMMLSSSVGRSNNSSRSNDAYNGYARGHNTSNTRVSRNGNSRSNGTYNGYARGHNSNNNSRPSSGRRGTGTPTTPTRGNGRYAPGHRTN